MTLNTYLTAEDIKQHLNINLDYVDEDEYLLLLAEVAFQSIQNYIDQPVSNFVDNDGEIEAPLRHAALLLIGTWYQNRESVTFGTAKPMPHSFEYLLTNYVNYESGSIQSNCGCSS